MDWQVGFVYCLTLLGMVVDLIREVLDDSRPASANAYFRISRLSPAVNMQALLETERLHCLTKLTGFFRPKAGSGLSH